MPENRKTPYRQGIIHSENGASLPPMQWDLWDLRDLRHNDTLTKGYLFCHAVAIMGKAGKRAESVLPLTHKPRGSGKTREYRSRLPHISFYAAKQPPRRQNFAIQPRKGLKRADVKSAKHISGAGGFARLPQSQAHVFRASFFILSKGEFLS